MCRLYKLKHPPTPLCPLALYPFTSSSDTIPTTPTPQTKRSKRIMGRMVLMLALCVLPALVSAARHVSNPLILQGRVYCDTCRAGFETSATTYLHGAKVRVECKNKDTQEVLYSTEGTTDSSGTYKIQVKEDHNDQVCDAVLVSSPESDCSSADPGRDRARVILTRYNGMVSDDRFANAMGFMRDQPLSWCNELLQQYQELDD